MRLAVVSPFLDRRHGTERCIVEQIQRIAAQPGWEIHIYSQRVEDLAVVHYSPQAFPVPPGSIIWHRVPSIPGPHLLQFLWWFAANWWQRRFDAHFRSLRFDLVYSPGINCFDADAIAVHIVFREFLRLVREDLRLLGSPPASWPRLIHRRLYYGLIIFLEKRIYPSVRIRLAAVSQLTASELARHYGRADVTVIPNAVDGGLFRPAVRAERRSAARRLWSHSPQDFVLLLLGNDWRNKGLPQLLEAMAQCPDLPLRLLVAGRDDQAPYGPLLNRLGLQDRVQFAAPSADVLRYYAAADVYAGPSLHDSFALPPAEAMACGLPVITSAQNGGAEMITDGADGFVLSDPRDAKELARLIRVLYEQPDLRRAIGERAACTARRYTWERNAAETRAFLAETLERKSRNMVTDERWKKAQTAESEYWAGVSQEDGAASVREVLDANESAARLLEAWLHDGPSPALEIGVGGLGVGLLGFMPTIPARIGVDPLPLIQPRCSGELWRKVFSLRRGLQFVRASGERLPFAEGHAGLVVCSNVLDHVRDAPLVLREVFRLLRPGGLLFLRVDTFSYFGLAKWHLWTKHRHANEILVRAHPYRFLERHVLGLCRASGFEVVRAALRGPIHRWLGHSARSSFLVRKPVPKQ